MLNLARIFFGLFLSLSHSTICVGGQITKETRRARNKLESSILVQLTNIKFIDGDIDVATWLLFERHQ